MDRGGRRVLTSDDLFAEERLRNRMRSAPLAARIRPSSLDEVVGQQHLLAPGAAFRAMVRSGSPISLILWGPPGSGKTTLARLVAAETGSRFEQLSATSAGVKDVREVLAAAQQRIDEGGSRTVLFLDEIHRFNKAQQDALLPGVEDGTVTLIGATTENPFFEVNSPLVSRTTIFRTEALGVADIETILSRAVTDPMRGLGGAAVDDDAISGIAERCGGDARLALNALEVAATIAAGRGDQSVGPEDVTEALQRRTIRYDKAGDRHFDVISAFIKSLRGSDPDATLYWLFTMVEAGEDPKFIARRMVIFASEDVGLADPTSLAVAGDAFRAVEVIGLPEAEYALAHAALHLAAAPKSNSVKRAIVRAKRLVEATAGASVPDHLRSATFDGERALGYGMDYHDPHDHPGGVVAQQYLPDEAVDAIVYEPGDRGAETDLAGRLGAADAALGKSPRDARPPGPDRE